MRVFIALLLICLSVQMYAHIDRQENRIKLLEQDLHRVKLHQRSTIEDQLALAKFLEHTMEQVAYYGE